MPGAVFAVRFQIGDAEWDQCVHLAACYRLVALSTWHDLIGTHLSARVPGSDHHFLINPYGMRCSEITASSRIQGDHADAEMGL